MELSQLSAPAVRNLIKNVGRGETFTAQVQDVAQRVGLGERTLWSYLETGVPPRRSAVATRLRALRPARKVVKA